MSLEDFGKALLDTRDLGEREREICVGGERL
jgi:hypothetical protein